MLELTNHTAKLSSVNLRAEIHGEEKKPACDLKFETVCGSEVLAYFAPELRSTLFKKNENPDLADQATENELTELRFPKLGPLKWGWEGTGYSLTIDYGMGGKSNVKLSDCKVDGVKIEPMTGGSVALSFRVIAHPDAKDTGRISELIQQDVTIDLTAPEPANAEQLFKSAA